MRFTVKKDCVICGHAFKTRYPERFKTCDSVCAKDYLQNIKHDCSKRYRAAQREKIILHE